MVETSKKMENISKKPGFNVVPVVFTFDKRIVLGAAVTIKSLLDTALDTTVYDVYCYHPDIDDKTVAEFEKMVANIGGGRHKITFQFIDKIRFVNAPINKGGSWTEIVYYRLLIPELLPQYDKVIYADTDVLFKGDLSEVYEMDMTGYDCGAVRMEPNNANMICHKYFPENKNKWTYISSFIIFNCKKMREDKFVDRVFDIIKTFNTRLKFFDLDTLNLACKKFLDLPYRYGVFQSLYYNDDITKASEYEFLKNAYTKEELEREKAKCIMLHYAGKPGKPWRFKHSYPDYLEYINNIPKSLRRYTFRDWRKRLFSKV